MSRLIVGLTGQSGSGKSTVSRLFKEADFEIIDCDLVARQVTSNGSDCCKALAEIFPTAFDKGYALDRAALAAIVFNDKSALNALNETIFPFINDEIDRRIAEYTIQGSEKILLDAPTLFEAGADKKCDVIVSCIADKDKRIQRIMRRDRLTREQAESRIGSQKGDDFFIAHSDYVITNNETLERLKEQTKEIIERLQINNGSKT